MLLLYYALRLEDLTKLRVKDVNQERRSVPHLCVQGRGDKLRYLPTHSKTLRLVAEYPEAAGRCAELDSLLVRRIRGALPAGTITSALTPGAVYAEVVFYMDQVGITGDNMAPYALRATAGNSPLEQNADIALRQDNKRPVVTPRALSFDGCVVRVPIESVSYANWVHMKSYGSHRHNPNGLNWKRQNL
ncbi:hypothetical protein [Rhodoferax ferrireducens]|uniref:hypothetical protein n=1 Tax=Rhodoferax ferrireducens TaxID=192843 RepID=UPI00130031E5|nr:hypothetical protein [Rhodoferax ferrireducens]